MINKDKNGQPLPWTGERYVPEISGQIEIEHLHRYIFTTKFVAGKDVRPEVAKQVINSGYDLTEMRPLGMSLEEIFLELTGSESKKK